MNDLDKAIKGLECCIEKLETVTNKAHGFNCTVCPYFSECDSTGYLVGLPLLRDALVLLDFPSDRRAEEGRNVEQLMVDIHTLAEEVRKHNENMIGVRPLDYDVKSYGFRYACGSCRHKVYREWNFCPNCGREMKWDEAD